MMTVDEKRAQIIFHRLGMPVDELNQRVQAVKNDALADRQRFLVVNPRWDVQKDARLIVFDKFNNICERTQFTLHILDKLLDDAWCQENLEIEIHQETDYKMALMVEFEASVKYSFGMSLFALIESSFRVFLRALDPVACKGATGTFDSIYKSLLGARQLNYSNAERKSAEELLDFIRLVRNLMHNDGVYFDEENLDKIVSYNGSLYRFAHGKPVDFIYWEVLLTLADDIRKLLVRIVANKRISSLVVVTDPFVAHFL
jgi:hypothetical protein